MWKKETWVLCGKCGEKRPKVAGEDWGICEHCGHPSIIRVIGKTPEEMKAMMKAKYPNIFKGREREDEGTI